MTRRKFDLRFIPIILLLLAAACGGGRIASSGRLPANVMAYPKGMVGVVSASTEGTIEQMMVALGIPFEPIPLDTLAKIDLSDYRVMLVDEGALDDPRAAAGYPRLLDRAKNGGTLLVLRQSVETVRKLRSRVREMMILREVDYPLTFRIAVSGDPIVRVPNTVTRADLDSLARGSRQLARSGSESRAILAANVLSPDSSATLLWEPFGNGKLWYCTFPLVARAAAGFEAEQKMAANLLSEK
jgi:hypothetical protein